MMYCLLLVRYFFFNATATTDIYTLSLHDALPILQLVPTEPRVPTPPSDTAAGESRRISPGGRQARSYGTRDRKSTRLNSSHTVISYAVFCLKKKKSR